MRSIGEPNMLRRTVAHIGCPTSGSAAFTTGDIDPRWFGSGKIKQHVVFVRQNRE
jgi:hypothetical protein